MSIYNHFKEVNRAKEINPYAELEFMSEKDKKIFNDRYNEENMKIIIERSRKGGIKSYEKKDKRSQSNL